MTGTLLAVNIKVFKSGLFAVKTHLRWTKMENIPSVKSVTNDSITVVSSLCNESYVADLWKLDMFGITDTVESNTKSEIHVETLQHLKIT